MTDDMSIYDEDFPPKEAPPDNVKFDDAYFPMGCEGEYEYDFDKYERAISNSEDDDLFESIENLEQRKEELVLRKEEFELRNIILGLKREQTEDLDRSDLNKENEDYEDIMGKGQIAIMRHQQMLKKPGKRYAYPPLRDFKPFRNYDSEDLRATWMYPNHQQLGSSFKEWKNPEYNMASLQILMIIMLFFMGLFTTLLWYISDRKEEAVLLEKICKLKEELDASKNEENEENKDIASNTESEEKTKSEEKSDNKESEENHESEEHERHEKNE